MEWKTSIICPIHKKGEKLDCHNYRGISLLSTMYKIYTNIIKMKLEIYSESMIGEYQVSFRRGRSTTDQLFTVKQLLEKFWEYDIDLYQIFVAFKQAYDSIKREKLYAAMQEMGIPNKLIRLVRSTMTETKAQVQIQGKLTEDFEVKQGIKQGDGLVSILFNIGLEYIIRKLTVSTNSTLLYKSVQIVDYMDDINIMARTFKAAKETFQELTRKANEIGLIVNESKTKWLVQSKNIQQKKW
jgi:sorting nexin-29